MSATNGSVQGNLVRLPPHAQVRLKDEFTATSIFSVDDQALAVSTSKNGVHEHLKYMIKRW